EGHLAKTVAALERVAGRRPAGTRSSHSAKLIRQYGYIYRSEGSADQRPYYEFDEGGGNGLVNLPMHYVIDDAMYFNFNWLGTDASAQRITDPERVGDIWWAAFRQQYNAGGYLNVCMHPFQSGRALWEGRWPLNTYRDRDATKLSRSALERLAMAEAMTLTEYRTAIATRQRNRETHARLAARYDAALV